MLILAKYLNIMKKIAIIMTFCLGLFACSDNKKQEKELLDNILKVHDKLMASDEVLMKNKMQIDSLLKLPAKDTTAQADIKAIASKLKTSEEAMENWMHNFEPDMTGKSHDEIMKYYNEQQKGIMAIDSQLNEAVKESTEYLSNKSK
jgi:hypothetical protein